MIAFLYSNVISFEATEKEKNIPISGKFISNIVAILSNMGCIHHSHKKNYWICSLILQRKCKRKLL